MNGEFIDALQQISKEKDIPLDTLIETVESALATALGRPDDAIAYWERAIRVNPWLPRYHFSLARIHAEIAASQPHPAHARESSETSPARRRAHETARVT